MNANLPAVRSIVGLVDITEFIGDKNDRETGLTPRSIPRPPVEELDATGALKPKERKTLADCEAAREHHGTARWMIGMALESINKRRLYRGDDGDGTWDEYVREAWDMAPQNAHWHIKEWRMRAVVSKILEKTPPDSHVRALLPLEGTLHQRAIAARYKELVDYAAEHQLKVTERVVSRLVVRLVEDPDEELETSVRAALESPSPRVEPEHTAPAEPTDAEPPTDLSGMAEAIRNHPVWTAGDPAQDGEEQVAAGQWSMDEVLIRRFEKWVNLRIAATGEHGDRIAMEALRSFGA
ncbi:hypothetical protein [Streptomyces sp. NBC_01304]|uniref:hypothetical protein n=1 Tax=Streptomyces sp. NBC_01304 TaxID=2903818 RepID=UPI002E13A40B|nr:hypothetical protein OG430_44630 [Streptomyces sp. NBC_01304]